MLSVGGLDPDAKVKEFLTGIPSWSREASAQPEAQGTYICFDDDGKAISIEPFRISGKEIVDEGDSNSKKN
jgi:calcineurin-like phosphoesterase